MFSYVNCFEKKIIQSGSSDEAEKPKNGDRVSVRCTLEGKYFEYVFDIIAVLDTDKGDETQLHTSLFRFHTYKYAFYSTNIYRD